jgi:hypothetical protein
MTDSRFPEHHEVPQVDAAHGYLSATVAGLCDQGVDVVRSWLDPYIPAVDATIVYRSRGASAAGLSALVWHEWTGWTSGAFVSGVPGETTRLRDAVPLGGGVLPDPARLAWLVENGATAPAAPPRAAMSRDGLFDRLRAWEG